MENKDQITALNTLTATLIDSVNGYRDAVLGRIFEAQAAFPCQSIGPSHDAGASRACGRVFRR